MAVSSANPAPYAPSSTITSIFDVWRNRSLPTPFTPEVLGRAGVSDSLIPRTMQALQTLDAIDEAGAPTAFMEKLRRAPEDDVKPLMAEWIKSAYADVLNFADPNDDESKIRDAFRSYNPVGQQPRMVSLFIGLCRAAGLRTVDTATNAARPRVRKAVAPIASVRVAKKPVVITPKTGSMTIGAPAGIPVPLAALLTKLPAEGGTWTQAERDRFESAFRAMLDFSYTISEATVAEEEEEADDE